MTPHMIDLNDEKQLQPYLKQMSEDNLRAAFASASSSVLTWYSAGRFVTEMASQSPWYVRWIHKAFAKKVLKESDAVAEKLSQSLLDRIGAEIRSRQSEDQEVSASVH